MEELKVIDKRIDILPDEPPTNALSIVAIALQKGYDTGMIEKMMDLQERYEEREAKKAYTEAMALFKANPPKIEKDRKVSYKAGGGTTSYSHASLANVTEKINTGLGEHGLSASWVTLQNEKTIKVTCTITHKMGHSESTSLTAEPDTSGSKNSIQAIGSTISYLERYTILALTGLATADMDDDGKGSEINYISEEQQKTIKDMISKKNVDEVQFLEYMKAESIETIMDKDFQKAMQALKIAKGRKPKDILCPDTEKERPITDCDLCKRREGCPSYDN